MPASSTQMLTISLPTFASVSFESFSFNNQSDFAEQLLPPSTGFPFISYIPLQSMLFSSSHPGIVL